MRSQKRRYQAFANRNKVANYNNFANDLWNGVNICLEVFEELSVSILLDLTWAGREYYQQKKSKFMLNK